ncbi:hypothetical protein [Nostoc sp.]
METALAEMDEVLVMIYDCYSFNNSSELTVSNLSTNPGD